MGYSRMTTKENRSPSQGPEQKRRSVAVIYHFFPHYRKAVVEALARSELVDFTFIGDDHEYLDSIEPAKFSDSVRFQLAPTHRLFGPFMWQWGAITWAIKPEFDTIIMHSVPHWPCTWIGALLARVAGKQVYFWGHGFLYRPKGLKGLARRLFYSLAHEHLVYSERAKAIAIECGWSPDKVHAIYNSLDTEAQRAIRDSHDALQWSRTRLSIFKDDLTPVVICTTRLISIRRLDLLLDALAILAKRGRRANLILVGDGPERNYLALKASLLGLMVHFEGACYDEHRIGELINSANVSVAPGKVGLTAMHSMAFGVPVVTHGNLDNQMPESEAIIQDQTGSWFKEGDVEDLAIAIEPWILGTQRPSHVRANCIAMIEGRWNPQYQRQLIEEALHISRA